MINYYQAGGQVNAQAVARDQQLAQSLQMNELFQAIALSPQQALQMLQLQGIDPNQIMQLVQSQAQSGNPAAVEAMNALQQMNQMARNGAKLQYLRTIKGGCPDGYEKQIFKKGGRIDCGCVKKQEAIPAKEMSVLDRFYMKCGGKTKKKQMGDKIESEACGGRAKKKKAACGTKMKRFLPGGDISVDDYSALNDKLYRRVNNNGKSKYIEYGETDSLTGPYNVSATITAPGDTIFRALYDSMSPDISTSKKGKIINAGYIYDGKFYDTDPKYDTARDSYYSTRNFINSRLNNLHRGKIFKNIEPLPINYPTLIIK